MNATNAKSIYDRTQHQETLKSLLEPDLFLLTDGKTPREKFADRTVYSLLADGSHPWAKSILESLGSKFTPYSTRFGLPSWNDYAVLGPDDAEPQTRKETFTLDKMTYHSQAIDDLALWVNHLFMVRSVLPSFGVETEMDNLLIDVDVRVEGEEQNLYLLPSDWLVDMFAPWVDAVAATAESFGKLRAEWLLSGNRGFWLNIFFDGPGSRNDALALRNALVANVGGDKTAPHQIRHYLFDYKIDGGSLSPLPCRIPWSFHQSTKNVSVNIDPFTGEPDLLQFRDTPRNSISLSDLSRSLEAASSDTAVFAVGGLASDPVASEVADQRSDDATEGQGQAYRGSLYGESTPQGQNWTVQDVLSRAVQGRNQRGVDSWESMLPQEIPAGQTNELLIWSGALARTLKLLIDADEVDLDQVRTHGPDACVPEFLLDEIGRRMTGDGTQQRLADVRGYIRCDLEGVASGEKKLYLPNFITQEEVVRCRELADEIRSQVKSYNKPSADDLAEVLALFIIKSKHRGSFKMTHDYAVRRLGWIADDTPRDAAEAKAARDKFVRLMGWFLERSDRCRIKPLVRRTFVGRLLTDGPNLPSEYVMLWGNWGFATAGQSEKVAA